MERQRIALILAFVFAENLVAGGNTSTGIGTCAVPPVSDDDFDCFVKAQAALLLSSREQHMSTQNTLADHESRISALTTALQVLLDRLDSVQTELNSLKTSSAENFRVVNEKIENLNMVTKQLNSKLQETDRKANEALKSYQNCLINIGFTVLEGNPIWRGSGYPDSHGYVLTGIDNNDRNDIPDSAFRRRMQLQKGSGEWKEISVWR